MNPDADYDIFMDKESGIRHIRDTGRCRVQDRNLRIYKSAVPSSYALEVNAGLADAIGIVRGAEILFR